MTDGAARGDSGVDPRITSSTPTSAESGPQAGLEGTAEAQPGAADEGDVEAYRQLVRWPPTSQPCLDGIEAVAWHVQTHSALHS